MLSSGRCFPILPATNQLSGVGAVVLDTFGDHRGQNIHLWEGQKYNVRFVEDNVEVSTRNVLRGIHGDSRSWKLVTCLHGTVYYVVVNCDPASSEYHWWQPFVLSDENHLQVLVPPKFGHGYAVMTEEAVFHYKQSTYYDRSKQFTFRYDDPELKIWWPIKDPILSMRDEGLE